jgi:methionyl-tRNA formyltransferase
LKLAVAATAPLGADVLERLAEHHEISFLITRPDRPRGRGRQVGAPPAKETAVKLGIPVRQPERLDESFSLEDADTVVVVAYGALIPESLLDRARWLNVHPSLLPRWRGAAPVERAIMAGDDETGVTIHETTPELDAGPVAAQQSFLIGAEDDAGVVYERAGELAAELLGEVLSGSPELVPQPEGGVTYADRLTPEDRELDWNRPPTELLNQIRALSPHIGARGDVDGRRLTVWRARLANDDSPLTAGGLELVEVQPEGRRRMSGEEYLRGLRGSGSELE